MIFKSLLQDLKTGFTHGISQMFTRINWEEFFFRRFNNFGDDSLQSPGDAPSMRRAQEEEKQAEKWLNKTKVAATKYSKTMLTPEELQEFKQAIDTESDDSPTKKDNQLLYESIAENCPLSLCPLLNAEDPPITIIGKFPDRKYHRTYNYSSLSELITTSVRKGQHPQVPDTKDTICQPHITYSIGFYEVDFNYIREEIKKWKEKVRAQSADKESKEEDVHTATYAAAKEPATAEVENATIVKKPFTPPASSLEELRASRAAYFNFPQENEPTNSNRIVTPSTSPSST